MIKLPKGIIIVIIMTIFNEDAHFTLKCFTEGSSYQKTLSEKDKSITKLELTKN